MIALSAAEAVTWLRRGETKFSDERNRRSTGTRSSSITPASRPVSTYRLIRRRANSATPPAASRIITSERHASVRIIAARSAATASAVASAHSMSIPRSMYDRMLLLSKM